MRESTQASHRDPLGRLLVTSSGAFRFLRAGGLGAWAALDSIRAALAPAKVEIISGTAMDSAAIARMVEEDGRFAEIQQSETWAAVLAHPKLPFVTYAEEWTPGMLARAGNATLDVGAALASIGWRLKDATPSNLVFDGTRIVFVDALSAEPIPSGARVWPPFSQFMNAFVFPLQAVSSGRTTVRRAFASGIDGLSVTEMANALGWRRWFPPYLLHVGITNALQRRGGDAWKTEASAASTADSDRARTVGLLNHLRRLLKSAARSASGSSAWTDYELSTHDNNYHSRKRSLVLDWCKRFAVRTALDVGANEGSVSMAMAGQGLYVVAAERDEAAAERIWRRAAAGNASVTPVIVDITDATPARGWRQRERLSFPDRAEGVFDAVVALAVLHHILAASGASVGDILDQLGRLSRRVLIVEHVQPQDAMFVHIARGRENLLRAGSLDSFRTAARFQFTVVDEVVLTPTRTLFLLAHR